MFYKCDRRYEYPFNYISTCSSHGSCIQNKCNCYSDWIGISDFVWNRGYDCDIQVSVIQGLAITSVILAIFAILFILYHIVREQTWKQIRRYKEKSLCYLFFLLSNWFILGNIARIMNSKQNMVVGDNIGITLSKIGIVISSIMGTSIYFISIMKFTKGYSKMMSNSSRRDEINEIFDRYISFSIPITIFWIMIFATIFTASLFLSQSYSDDMNIIYISTSLLSYVIYIFPVMHIYRIFLIEIKIYLDSTKHRASSNILATSVSHSSNNTSADVGEFYWKIQTTSYFMISCLTIAILFHVIFLSMYYIRRKVVYLNLCQETCISILTCIMVWSLSTNATNSSSSSSSSTTFKSKECKTSNETNITSIKYGLDIKCSAHLKSSFKIQIYPQQQNQQHQHHQHQHQVEIEIKNRNSIM